MTSENISLCSLINWNIAKTLQKNPSIDLKEALELANERLKNCNYTDQFLGDKSKSDEDLHHITCAVLAWRRLGQHDIERLYEYLKENSQIHEYECQQFNANSLMTKVLENCNVHEIKSNYPISGSSIMKLSLNPVIVQVANTSDCCRNKSNQKKQKSDVMDKIDAACCMESKCTERLAELDTATTTLKRRAACLAKREAERVELLERAEAAWRDLELGYQRRLRLAEEKEVALSTQIKKFVEERNGYKMACTNLVQQLRERGDAAEVERKKLNALEKDLRDRACVKHKTAEEAARHDATLADFQCRGAQLDGDLQFKEEQARLKVTVLQTGVHSTKVLSHESERVVRAELTGLKEQLQVVTQQLVEEDANNAIIKNEMEELRKLKQMMVEDLEGCKVMCDGNMQKYLDQLRSKQKELTELKDKVIECKCRLPVDVAVEVKRTPSLAAVCHCPPDDKIEESCSCTSLRTKLLSNLFSDLFSGLQADFGDVGTTMPCQLLKCLEDKHNWDRASAVKTRLRDYFAKLVLGELDIAIATSIERYHARWVGASCADHNMSGDSEDDMGHSPSCCLHTTDTRSMESRTRELAMTMAERMVQERAEVMANERVKTILSTGPPPCECVPSSSECVEPNDKKKDNVSTYWLQTHKGTNRRICFEGLLKKNNREQPMCTRISKRINDISRRGEEGTGRVYHDYGERSIQIGTTDKKTIKPRILKKKAPDIMLNSKKPNIPKNNKSEFLKSKIGQTLAINVCLCKSRKSRESSKILSNNPGSDNNSKTFSNNSKLMFPEMSNMKKPKLASPQDYLDRYTEQLQAEELSCRERVCFHNPPSNTSINRMLTFLRERQYKFNENSNFFINKENSTSQYLEPEKIFENCTSNNAPNTLSDVRQVSQNHSSIKNYVNNSVLNKCCAKATESEYIGTINLEKKSGHTRGCDNIKKNNISAATQSISKSNLENMHDQNKILNNHIINTVVARSYDKPTNIEPKVQMKIPLYKCASVLTENTTPYDIGVDLTKQTLPNKPISFTSDYDVKLLGVTIAEKSEYSTTLNDNFKNVAGLNLKHKAIEKQHNIIKRRKFKLNKDGMHIDNCNVKLENELKTEILKKTTVSHDNLQDENITNNSKSIDLIKQSNCVCCNDQTKELEKNMFQLLYEHLKSKLKEFQMTTCNSSCIHPDEEHKLLYSILNKVKIFISSNLRAKLQNTDEISLGDNWDRTYGLLQEYLKVKIKKAHVLYNPNCKSKENFQMEFVTKIYDLIESDFERLKMMCICNRDSGKNSEKTTAKTIDSASLKNENILTDIEYNKNNDIPVKCENNYNSILKKDTPLVSSKQDMGDDNEKQMSSHKIDYNCLNKYINFNTINENNSTHSQNEHKSTIKDEVCNTPSINDVDNQMNHDLNAKKEKENFKHSNVTLIIDKMKGPTSLLVIPDFLKNDQQLNLISLNEDPSQLPYIGYTIDCSCDPKLGPCFCTKALINDNYNEIQQNYDVYIKQKLLTEAYCGKCVLKMNKLQQNYMKDDISCANDKKSEQAIETALKIKSSLTTSLNNKDDKLVLKDSTVETNNKSDSMATQNELDTNITKR